MAHIQWHMCWKWKTHMYTEHVLNVTEADCTYKRHIHRIRHIHRACVQSNDIYQYKHTPVKRKMFQVQVNNQRWDSNFVKRWLCMAPYHDSQERGGKNSQEEKLEHKVEIRRVLGDWPNIIFPHWRSTYSVKQLHFSWHLVWWDDFCLQKYLFMMQKHFTYSFNGLMNFFASSESAIPFFLTSNR